VTTSGTPLAGIHHVAVGITDLDAALAFWCGVLGCTISDSRPDFPIEGAWLDAGAQQIHLFRADPVPAGGRHVAMQVADLEAMVARCEAAGLRVRRGGYRLAGGHQAFVLDPDGNMVEFNQPDGYALRPVAPDDPAFVGLCADFDAELADRYGDLEPHPALGDRRFFGLEAPDVVLVAFRFDTPVGCGALRPAPDLDGAGELKRMYVAPAARGAGVGRWIVGALVNRARRAGYSEVVLQTGDRQPEAMALYERCGFTAMEPWGTYAELDLSRCYRLGLHTA
jgi:catechol 2,3-dioxygenase-like lactoylglutathione lyase family enzyme/GNAT superfamily N-acetyltransferase